MILIIKKWCNASPLYDLACQLHVPLHGSDHSKGKAEGVSYPEKISQEMEKISNEIRSGNSCDDPNALSKLVLGNISKFRWTITGDGKDYKPDNNGCSGVTSLTNKPNKACPPSNRTHSLTRLNDTKVIPRNNQQVEIGS
ncbi:MAG: hypothetical protein GY787_04150 [Alteromonadales bacterium]|nr:hypothetical protein [Alteromonadales bacterium]